MLPILLHDDDLGVFSIHLPNFISTFKDVGVFSLMHQCMASVFTEL